MSPDLYLNCEGRWPGFEWSGLELGDDGALRLSSLPLLEPPEELVNQPTPDGPAGIAAGSDGTLWWGGAAGHGLLARDPCDGSIGAVPCIGGDGDDGTRLGSVRALLFHPARSALVVADACSHELLLFDPGSFQLLDVWGGAGAEPGLFDRPWSLASDADGSLFAVDRGNRRVQKFDLRGSVIASFWETARNEASFDRPVEVAVAGAGRETRVYVLDLVREEILVLDVEGHALGALSLPGGTAPLGLLVHRGAIYLGDNERRRLLKLLPDGTLVGEALGYEGPVGGLAADPDGSLWLHPGSDASPLRLDPGGAHVQSGVLWSDSLGDGERPRAWQRLSALGAPLDVGAHFRFFLRSSDSPDIPPPPAPGAGLELFDPEAWRAMPQDVPDVLIGTAADATHYLWIGAHLTGDGLQSPRLDQLRLGVEHESYARYLPAIYRDPSKGADPAILDRFLYLFESFFADVESEVDDLDRLFDPAALPAEWLPWLASWLAFDLDEEWPEEEQRLALSGAFAGYAWRGTARGLRAALRSRAGVDAHVEEPLAQTGWWALPPTGADPESPAAGVSVLGFTTVLVPAGAQGAVLGTMAILDASDLIRGDDFGAPLFEETAHRFSVELYRSQVAAAGKLDEVRAVIERQKPAHTTYQLCLIEPRFRVGWQARLGIDSVVADDAPTPAALGSEAAGGVVLTGERARRLGEEVRVGQTTRLPVASAEPKNDYPSGRPHSADRR